MGVKFELLEPASLTEAVRLLERIPQDTKILAGGTDLLIQIKRRMIKPAYVLSLSRIHDLKRLEYVPGEGMFIGAMVTHAQVASHPVVRDEFRALSQACLQVGSPQVRNLGTVGGNLCNASPAADTAPALLVLEARVNIAGPQGEYSLPLKNFFISAGKTRLASNEILKEIFIPEPAQGTQSTYLKLGRRRAMEIAIAGVALAARPKKSTWEACRLALSAVAPTPLLCPRAASILEGERWKEELLQRAGEAAKQEASPIDDQRASAFYRREMVAVLTVRAAKELIEQRGALEHVAGN